MKPPHPHKIRVGILESHRCVGEGLGALLNADPYLDFVGQATCPASAENLLSKTRPDVVICDILLGGISTVDLFSRRAFRDLKFHKVFFSASSVGPCVRRAIDSGAAGFVLKTEPWSLLRHAIWCTGTGEKILSSAVATAYRCDLSSRYEALVEKLTAREKQVLLHIGEALGNRDIAERLGVSPKTVEAHKEHLKSKLAMPSARELRHFASNWRKDCFGPSTELLSYSI